MAKPKEEKAADTRAKHVRRKKSKNLLVTYSSCRQHRAWDEQWLSPKVHSGEPKAWHCLQCKKSMGLHQRFQSDKPEKEG